MRVLRERLSYANVMATAALFLALTGVGVAAFKVPKNSVGTKQLKKHAVKAAKVKPNSLTGATINEATLGTVPSAQTAGTATSAQSAEDAQALGGEPASAFQARVSDACSSGEAISSIAADGGVGCQATGSGTITEVLAGTGLTGGGDSGSVSLAADPTVVQNRVGGTCSGVTAVQSVAQNGTVNCTQASAVGDVQSASIPSIGPDLAPYAAISGMTISPSEGANGVASLSPNVPLVARNLVVSFDSAPTGADDLAGVILERNGTVALECTVEGPSTDTTCTTSQTAAIPPGSELALHIINGTTSQSSFHVGFSLTPG